MLKNKTIYILLIAITLIFAINTIVLAEKITVIDTTSLAILDPNEWKPDNPEPSPTIQQKGANVAGIIQVVGASVAVITLMIIGIRYLLGSAENRAEYKKTMWPYLIGAIMVFGISSLLRILMDIVQGTFGN